MTRPVKLFDFIFLKNDVCFPKGIYPQPFRKEHAMNTPAMDKPAY